MCYDVTLRSVRVSINVAEQQRAKLLHFCARVSVALAIQHAKSMCLIISLPMTSVALPHFSTIFEQNG